MRTKDWFAQNVNGILAFLFTLGMVVFAGLRFDYYFDLNDDLLMKNIVSGAYTGTPDAHNVFMLWPIGIFISLLYKIVGGVPWYGLFMTACYYVCVFLILKRSLFFCRTNLGKLSVALTETVLLGALFLNHFIMVQFTTTSAFLAGTAAFLLLTMRTMDVQSLREFIKRSIPLILLSTLAFLIRFEVLLLLLPLICVAGIILWGSEKVIFTKEHAMQYFSVFGLIILGLLVSQSLHMFAYNSMEWKSFSELNDNRAELYDLQRIPAYEGNEDFYESIGLSESEKKLLDNYNFGMDEEIDGKLIGKIADYAEMIKSKKQPFNEKFNEKFSQYIHRFISGYGVADSDYPWNYVILTGYLFVLVLAFLERKWSVLWKLTLLLGTRTVLWLYILIGGRSPERITDSLYLTELCILGAMLFVAGSTNNYVKSTKLDRWKGKQVLICFCLCVFLIFGLTISREKFADIDEQLGGRAYAHDLYQELFEYLSTGERVENFYFIDVYSWSPISERVFACVDNSLDNYDIMGGWVCKSPLQREKLDEFGISTMEQALRDLDNVYFVKRVDVDMKWLKSYYSEHDTPIETYLVKTIAEQFEIYAVDAID